jgi:hypothetical protein
MTSELSVTGKIAAEMVCIVGTIWLNDAQHQERQANTLIRPSGTFSRKWEKGKLRRGPAHSQEKIASEVAGALP